MIELKIIILIFWLHFIAEFCTQSVYMSVIKGREFIELLPHCILYSIPFIFIGWKFALIVGLCHMPIDYITFTLTSYYFRKECGKCFYIVFGINQALHMTIIMLIYDWIMI